MNNLGLRMLLMAVVIAVVVIIPVLIIKKVAKKSKNASKYLGEPPKDSPFISVTYMPDGSVFDDGKCGWLDLENGHSESETIELNFKKKKPATIYIPLKTSKYRITYRTKSKAGMAASGVLKAINENNGAMGAFANAVYDAGGMSGQLSSVVVDVAADFVMKLECTTNGIDKSCRVVD